LQVCSDARGYINNSNQLLRRLQTEVQQGQAFRLINGFKGCTSVHLCYSGRTALCLREVFGSWLEKSRCYGFNSPYIGYAYDSFHGNGVLYKELCLSKDHIYNCCNYSNDSAFIMAYTRTQD